MAAPLTSMLKTSVPSKKLTLEQLGVGDSEVDRFDVGKNGVEHAKKLRKSKSEKTSKS